MIPKKVYITFAVWNNNRMCEFIDFREEPIDYKQAHGDNDAQTIEYINLSQVWHDATSEEPQGDEWHIAYIDIFGSIQSLRRPSVTFDTFPSLAEFAAGVGMQYWAYVDDLLPKGGNA